MTQWYLRYSSNDSNLISFFKELVKTKKKYVSFLRLTVEDFPNREEILKIANENKIPIEEDAIAPKIGLEGSVDMGYWISTFISSNGNRNISISIIGADEGLGQDFLDIIKIAGKNLQPLEFEVICEEEGPKPVYKGKWNFEIFKKKILPKIEFAKKLSQKTHLKRTK